MSATKYDHDSNPRRIGDGAAESADMPSEFCAAPAASRPVWALPLRELACAVLRLHRRRDLRARLIEHAFEARRTERCCE